MSTSVSTTRPDLLSLRADRKRRFWGDMRYVAVRLTLWMAIIAPFVFAGEYLLFRIVIPAQNAASAAVPTSSKAPPIPPPFAGPGIIVVQPPETETIVAPAPIPESQRRSSGKHRAEEGDSTPLTTAPPSGTRRIAPATPSTTPSAPSTTPSVAPPSGSSARSAPPVPTVSSSTPIYDTLRSETIRASLTEETAIPE
jgi:hypothetical protein